jgi:hypothetical protein
MVWNGRPSRFKSVPSRCDQEYVLLGMAFAVVRLITGPGSMGILVVRAASLPQGQKTIGLSKIKN